jgi:hypothetical protein
MFVNRVLRTSGLKQQNGENYKMRSHNLYSLPSILKITKERRMSKAYTTNVGEEELEAS